MPKPVIGITADYTDAKPAYLMNYAYCDAVIAAGGLPLVLPFRSDTADIPQLLDMLDGIIFSGGDDLDPRAWDETAHPKSTPLRPERETYERVLIEAVESRRLPTLGICLGSQLMNVHRGGSLHQFIPDLGLSPTLEHRKLNGVDSNHPITVVADSLLAETLETTAAVTNSAHKQAYHRLGRNLSITATAPDGVPEAIEDTSLPLFLGVQWHPERIHTQPQQHNLFTLLVRKARENHKP